MWDTSCRDWRERLLSRSSMVPTLPLFEAEAARALRIFKRLRLPDVIGNPTLGEAGDAWIFDIVAAIFGAYDPATNRRQLQELFLLVPKKNAKSTYAAAILVTAIIMNRRPAAELLMIAPTKEIADIAFKQASGIIRLDAELTKLFHLQRHIRTITHRRTDATLQIKAADTDVITGSKSYFILVDETHVFAKKANAADVFVEVRGGLAARPDGFMIQITTQSKEPPQGVFKAELAMARDIRDGLVKLPRLAVLYEIPDDLAREGGWKNQKYWPLVNPNMGRSVDEAFLQNALTAAERDGDAALALLASQHFNVQVGLSLRFDHWAGARYWEGAADKTLTFEELLRRSEVVVFGIDGGGLDDLLGLGAIGRCKVTKRWLLWSHAWVQRDVLELRKEIAPSLRDFEREGTLTICTEPTQDVREVADYVEWAWGDGLLPEAGGVGLDPVGVAQIVDEIVSRGIPDDMLYAVPQGYRLAGAVWGVERKLKDGTLIHAGSAMMNWVIGNVKVEQRGNAVLITKQAAGKAKIDPLAAALNAATLMSRNPVAVGGPSVYESRGLTELVV